MNVASKIALGKIGDARGEVGSDRNRRATRTAAEPSVESEEPGLIGAVGATSAVASHRPRNKINPDPTRPADKVKK
jgi:hypothetical protein